MVAFDTCHVFVACEFLAEEHDGGPVQSSWNHLVHVLVQTCRFGLSVETMRVH